MSKNKPKFIENDFVENAIQHINELPVVDKPKQLTLQQAITKLAPSLM